MSHILSFVFLETCDSLLMMTITMEFKIDFLLFAPNVNEHTLVVTDSIAASLSPPLYFGTVLFQVIVTGCSSRCRLAGVWDAVLAKLLPTHRKKKEPEKNRLRMENWHKEGFLQQVGLGADRRSLEQHWSSACRFTIEASETFACLQKDKHTETERKSDSQMHLKSTQRETCGRNRRHLPVSHAVFARRRVSVSVWYLKWKAVMFGNCTSLSLRTNLAFAAQLTACGRIIQFLIDRFREL